MEGKCKYVERMTSVEKGSAYKLISTDEGKMAFKILKIQPYHIGRGDTLHPTGY